MLSRLTRRAVAAMTAVLCLAVVLTGCGHGGAKHAAATPKQTAVAQEATVRTATCRDWRGAEFEIRMALVRGMREFFSGQVDQPGVHGQILPDKQAYDLFQSYCKQSYATGFDLYRIYGNAAAFTVPN